MTDTAALESLSDAIDQIDPDFAHQAVSWISVGLGGLAVVAPRRTAALFGVKSIDNAVPLLVRMVASATPWPGCAPCRPRTTTCAVR